MRMFERSLKLAGHRATADTMPDPIRDWFKVADPFIVHGHRLSSLYRRCFVARIYFIVLKILKNLCPPHRLHFEYLWNNDGQGALQ
jgi:hypothetical protein